MFHRFTTNYLFTIGLVLNELLKIRVTNSQFIIALRSPIFVKLLKGIVCYPRAVDRFEVNLIFKLFRLGTLILNLTCGLSVQCIWEAARPFQCIWTQLETFLIFDVLQWGIDKILLICIFSWEISLEEIRLRERIYLSQNSILLLLSMDSFNWRSYLHCTSLEGVVLNVVMLVIPSWKLWATHLYSLLILSTNLLVISQILISLG